MTQHARSLGDSHGVRRAGRAAATFLPLLRDNIAALRRAHAFLALQAGEGHDISPAAEWLLDNFHLVESPVGQSLAWAGLAGGHHFIVPLGAPDA